jgi:hypothetical protein
MAKGRVTAPGLNMHLAPGSEKIVHALAQGDEFTVIKTEKHAKLWLFVWHRDKDDFSSSRYGWVCADFVELIAPKVSPYMPPVHNPLGPLTECEPIVPRAAWFGLARSMNATSAA